MKNLIKLLSFLLITCLGLSCEKHVVTYDATTIPENESEFQLHYFVPVVTGSANNITKVELNGKLISNTNSTLVPYNAIPSGGVGRFYTTSSGTNNIKLYRGDNAEIVYDQDVELQSGKQNVFVYDFNKAPIVLDNGFPYPTITTEETGTTCWIRFYNFLYETEGVPTDLKLQYQYQYTMDVETGEKSEWLNLGTPAAFGESTGWEPVPVVKSVEISSSYARVDYRIRVIGTDGSDQGPLKVRNGSGNMVDYSDWWTAYTGRAYHHIIGGMRAATPISSVRQFTAR
ncbi:hypothetical protein GCM10027051_14500 [Niabella terrae]